MLLASPRVPVSRYWRGRLHRARCRGQGMTEFIVIVALVAVAAIGVYSAFGDVVRGQAAVAAVALSGEDNSTGRSLVSTGRSQANAQSRSKSLEDYEE
ncbi:MAG: hypothetical protein ACO3P5_03845 [Steroidobacteraceae bacterium]